MPDEEPETPTESEPEKTAGPEIVSPEGPDVTKLSAADKDILALRKQGHSIIEIGKRLRLSKTAVFDHLKRLQMKLIFHPSGMTR